MSEEKNLAETADQLIELLEERREEVRERLERSCQERRDRYVENGAGPELDYYDRCIAAFVARAVKGKRACRVVVYEELNARTSRDQRLPLAQHAARRLRADGFRSVAAWPDDRAAAEAASVCHCIEISFSW